jgi:hypothetical protein
MLKRKNSKAMDAYTCTKQAEKGLTNVVCQKADGNCFLRQERSADGGINATRDTITLEVHCETFKKTRRVTQKERRGMLTSGAVLIHDNTRPHTAACTRTLLEHFNWELFDHSPSSPDLAPSDFDIFTNLKN